MPSDQTTQSLHDDICKLQKQVAFLFSIPGKWTVTGLNPHYLDALSGSKRACYEVRRCRTLGDAFNVLAECTAAGWTDLKFSE